MNYLPCGQIWVACHGKREGGSASSDDTMCLVNRTDSYRTVTWPDLLMSDTLFHIHTRNTLRLRVKAKSQMLWSSHSSGRLNTNSQHGLVKKEVLEGGKSRLGSEIKLFKPTHSPQHTLTNMHISQVCACLSLSLPPSHTQHSAITIKHCLKIRPSPGWVAQLVGVLFNTPEGFRLDSWTVHTPRF